MKIEDKIELMINERYLNESIPKKDLDIVSKFIEDNELDGVGIHWSKKGKWYTTTVEFDGITDAESVQDFEDIGIGDDPKEWSDVGFKKENMILKKKLNAQKVLITEL